MPRLRAVSYFSLDLIQGRPLYRPLVHFKGLLESLIFLLSHSRSTARVGGERGSREEQGGSPNLFLDYEDPLFLRGSRASEKRARVKVTPREKGEHKFV